MKHKLRPKDLTMALFSVSEKNHENNYLLKLETRSYYLVD